MCGILGAINTRDNLDNFLKALDILRHRGPDDEGYYCEDNVFLGSRRLSVIDLKSGHQPMSNEDGSLQLIHNGEIYNFKELREDLSKKGHIFQTQSDTEAIIHAYEEYGYDCLKELRGMFAFAIWDKNKRALFLARDRLGIKPLYYASLNGSLIFASEIKAMLALDGVNKGVDLEALDQYLSFSWVPDPKTILKGIYKLPPGYFLVYKDGDLFIREYWDLKFDGGILTEKAWIERILDKFGKVTGEHLVSDVPLGVFLSGGIDSSSIVSMMAELMPPSQIKTFSIGFKEKSFDESSDARRIAEYFGTDHHEEILSPNTMLAVFPEILNLLDEPFADSSIIPTYLVSKFTRRHVKVALGGDGGDEFFLGYPSFIAHKLNNILGILPCPLRKTPLKVLARLAPISYNYMSLNFKARRFLKGLDFPEEVRHQVWIGSFTPQEQKRLFLPNEGLDWNLPSLYESTIAFFRNQEGADALDRAMYLYIKTYMTDDILTKVDRASMANSLEVRAPFLDTEFTEFAASIPSSFKLKNFNTKWILKVALKSRLPAATLKKSKQGFAVPVVKWLKSDLKPMLLDAFAKNKIEREGIFDYAYIKELVQAFLYNKNDTRKEIWALFMFEMWYDKWMR